VIRYQRQVLAERRVRADGLSGDTIAELMRALDVLERFGRRSDIDVNARTAVRIRRMTLVDHLEIEQAKRRILEGNFAAARYHLNVPERPSLKWKIARFALHLAPHLVRAAYVRLRPALGTQTP
jgi:hypothetical protein